MRRGTPYWYFTQDGHPADDSKGRAAYHALKLPAALVTIDDPPAIRVSLSVGREL